MDAKLASLSHNLQIELIFEHILFKKQMLTKHQF